MKIRNWFVVLGLACVSAGCSDSSPSRDGTNDYKPKDYSTVKRAVAEHMHRGAYVCREEQPVSRYISCARQYIYKACEDFSGDRMGFCYRFADEQLEAALSRVP